MEEINLLSYKVTHEITSFFPTLTSDNSILFFIHSFAATYELV